VSDVTPKTGGAAKAPCKKYPLGTCTYGAKCRFSHVVPLCMESGVPPTEKAATASSSIMTSDNFRHFMYEVFEEDTINPDAFLDGFKKQEDQFNGFSENEKEYLAFKFYITVFSGTRLLEYDPSKIDSSITDPNGVYNTNLAYLSFIEMVSLKTEGRKNDDIKAEALKQYKIDITPEQITNIDSFIQDNTGFVFCFTDQDEDEEYDDLVGQTGSKEDEDL
jgi:hypothetical protein